MTISFIPKTFHIKLILFVIVVTSISCKKEYLTKVQSKSLFAEPSTTELNAIYQDWRQRNLTPTAYQVIEQADLLSGAFRLKVVSFKLGDILEYAILIIPNTIEKVPVQLHVGGFGLGLTAFTVNLALSSSSNGPKSIMAIPALRGQSLEVIFNGASYKTPISSGVHCDAFDGATDDVLALLNLIAKTEANADVNRTGIRGGSRGGTVALLAAIRDKRIKRAIDVAGPINMLALTSANQNDPTYQCQFLDGFKNGQQSLAMARTKLISSSPFYFAEQLPLTQLHLGTRDTFVPFEQGDGLVQKMKVLPNSQNLELFLYDRGHTDLVVNNPEFAKRTEDFFAGL